MTTSSNEMDPGDLTSPQPFHILAAEVLERIASANSRDHAIWQTAYALGLAAGRDQQQGETT